MSETYAPPDQRERWGSRLGLILAMAGNAVGLGNFLRFPNQAVNNGGGSFMLAYFISLLLLGIPLMWIEWGIGRRGGALGYSTGPGMLQSLTRARWVRYAGALGIAMPLIIVIFYVYLESWTLGYAVQAVTGNLDAGASAAHFEEYTRLGNGGFLGSASLQGSWSAYGFFMVTALVNLWVLSRGLSKGIEMAAKIGMPILILAAVGLVARTLTLPDFEGRSAVDGLAIYWQPEWRQLFSAGAAGIWLAAAGQIFFTLSVGSGAINTYASYLTEDDDIALTGLATVSTNEFCEVILGGTLAIPAAYLFLGTQGVEDAASSSLGLAFIAMPQVFENMGFGSGAEAGGLAVAVFGGLWFGLLFLAGITSSLALSQPAMAWLQDAMGLTRRKAALVIGGLIILCVQPVILLPGVLGEFDYWAGTFGLVLFSTLEVILLMWVFGSKRAWAEIHKGADIRIPAVFRLIMTWITPLALLGMLGWWGFTQAWPILTLEVDSGGGAWGPGVLESQRGNIMLARWLMIGIVLLFVVLVAVAARRGHFRRLEEDRYE
jgi:SNF family Na+-dependent transporter